MLTQQASRDVPVLFTSFQCCSYCGLLAVNLAMCTVMFQITVQEIMQTLKDCLGCKQSQPSIVMPRLSQAELHDVKLTDWATS